MKRKCSPFGLILEKRLIRRNLESLWCGVDYTGDRNHLRIMTNALRNQLIVIIIIEPQSIIKHFKVNFILVHLEKSVVMRKIRPETDCDNWSADFWIKRILFNSGYYTQKRP